MQKSSVILIVFGIIVIFNPAIIAYLIGGFLIFVGVNIFMVGKKIGGKDSSKKDYVKFGDYKIFRGKK